MTKLDWTKDDSKRFNLVNNEVIDGLKEFAEKHGYDISSLIDTDQILYKSLDTIRLILHKMNFTIEVTETSSAGILSGSKNDDVWVRNHKYRWLIVEWNNDGALKHSYYNQNKETLKEEFFTSYYDAIYDAVCYIIENC